VYYNRKKEPQLRRCFDDVIKLNTIFHCMVCILIVYPGSNKV